MQNSSASNYYDNNLLLSSFSDLTDPRRQNKGNVQHRLIDMIFLVISAVVSGADTWQHIELFGKSQINWLRKYAAFENGIPSHDTLGRVFSAIDFNQLSHCFVEWTKQVSKLSGGEVVAIDGKTLRGSYDKANNKQAIHMVSAFACSNNVCIGQIITEEKSNEITAIPELLKILAIKGCIVTIDAMGCQKEIAQSILDKEADYVLAVKKNQSELYEQVKKLFTITKPTDYAKTEDCDHGRVETRTCTVISDLTFLDLDENEYWPGLKSVLKLESIRYDKLSGDTESDIRYYITSCNPNAEQLNSAIRQHWKIENNLHWILDVNFNEDAQRKRAGQSAENFNVLTKIAMSFLKNTVNQKKTSMTGKRYKAALSSDYREKVLNL